MTPELENEIAAFEALKPRLRALWTQVFPKDDEPYTSVIVPSVTLEPEHLVGRPEVLRYEETLLFLLIRLRNPHARIVYVTSLPIPPAEMDYYLQFLAGIPASNARWRLTLLSAQDASPRPLTEKILERPRLLERIRAAIPDRERAYLTVFRSTVLERRLAVRLGIPLNGADPGADRLLDKSGSRAILRDTGVELPPGRENLRSEAEILEALEFLQGACPMPRRAILKVNAGYWDEGHAVLELPSEGGRESLRTALRALRLSAPRAGAEAYLERFARHGGVVEGLLQGPDQCTVSVQVRINPMGRVTLTSTHDELRGGPIGLASTGCLFPARDEYRVMIQDAGLRVGSLLAGRGLTGRLSLEFLVWRVAAGWRIAGSEINLGFGGATHPLLAVRFLCEGALDAQTGLFRSITGRPKHYFATDHLQSPVYRGLLPEDLIDMLTMHQLHYSPATESGALCYMLGALSEYGRVGLVAVGNSREEALAVRARVVERLHQECGAV